MDTTRAALSATLEQLARNLELTPGVTDAQLATTCFDLRKSPSFSGDPGERTAKRALQINRRDLRSAGDVRSGG